MIDPLYHFGYGLSYTTLEYSELKITPLKPQAKETITISCKVKNTGNRDGDEVVQLYLKDRVASVTPYEQILRGFSRVSLKKGESRTVQFSIDPQRDLEILGLNQQWVLEPGVFDVRIGASSVDIQLEGEFELVP